MRVIRPVIRNLPNREIAPKINATRLGPAVGCSYWRYRTFATRPHPDKQKDEIDDGDLFGDSGDGTSNSVRDFDQEDRNADLLGLEESITEPSLCSFHMDHLTESTSSKDQLLHRPKLPTSIKRLNRILSRQRAVEIPEHELDEKFVRGRGPGGQAINKTNSSVSLTHIPTGIRVQAQPTRSREENRKVARKILGERLEVLRTTGQLPGYDIAGVIVDKPQDEGLMRSKKETKKFEEKVLSGAYTKKEVKEEKLRIRKLNKQKKAKRKYGKKGEDEVEGEEESDFEIDNEGVVVDVVDNSTRV
ncbi:hypothetical protein I203_103731 [Kwoniella mangroviensis CBS 8507]|uniref:uncharacterized protein n=1 Tax=Kwoniella mangroviensis CBS 8507 TaxID=1296122 RepID=UPI00080CEDAB|nr:uncharacterized protein I203_04174 [Kwoniella mangroviensis CBS 8507]OCF66598.1 hypothetical protein I203_04174 [Kwoniella mangroviensis CBS 8507]